MIKALEYRVLVCLGKGFSSEINDCDLNNTDQMTCLRVLNKALLSSEFVLVTVLY